MTKNNEYLLDVGLYYQLIIIKKKNEQKTSCHFCNIAHWALATFNFIALEAIILNLYLNINISMINLWFQSSNVYILDIQ